MADVPEDVKARAKDAVNAMCDLHDYAGRDAWERIVEEVIFSDRLTRPDTGARKTALEEAANDLSRFAEIETERAEGKREGSHARFAALWASIRLRMAASHVRALSDKGGVDG